MPTYQYRCADCASELEVVQKFTDASLTECPSCEGTLRKVFNAVGVVFKGSGFYATDNRTQGKKDAAKPAGSEAGTSTASESAKPASGSAAAGSASGTSTPSASPAA